MITAKLQFSLLNKNSIYAELYDLIEGYLYGLIRYGNIWGEFILSPQKNKLCAYCYLSHPNAMAKKYQTKHSKEILKKIIDKTNNQFQLEILNYKIEKEIPKWKTEKFLYIFTHAFDFTSPVTLGSNGKSLPIYFLPLSDKEREYAFIWAKSYQDHDRIWLSSEKLEIPAYKQMVEPNSELTLEGKEISEIIEKKTGIPTYYFLNRYWGRKQNDENRRCPQCGNKWRVEKNISEPNSFSNFAFQCKSCRFVSNEASTYDDERHARIGEYRINQKA